MTVASRVGRSIHPVIGHPYVRLVSGRGVFVTDDSGKEYLDAVAGIGVKPFPAEAGITARIDVATREAGLLVYPCAGIIDGKVGDSILMVPPLVISREEIGLLVDRLDRAIEVVSQAVLA